MFIPNFKILGTVVPKKSLTKHFTGEKEKWTNKGKDKHEDADFVLHYALYNKSYPMFVPNFKILGAVFPEKSLTKKKFTHRHTHTDKHCYGKDENYIPPHTSYAGGIIMIRKKKTFGAV